MTRVLQWQLAGVAIGLAVAYLVVAFIAWDLTWLSNIATAHPMARMVGLIMAGAIGGFGWITAPLCLAGYERAKAWDKYRETTHAAERLQVRTWSADHYQQRTNDTGDPGPFAQGPAPKDTA